MSFIMESEQPHIIFMFPMSIKTCILSISFEDLALPQCFLRWSCELCPSPWGRDIRPLLLHCIGTVELWEGL